jgi:nicotinamidase-related amidase
LRYDKVDTLVICGISTSGCVRAGASDAFSHNFRVILVDEACGDRSPQAHKANMFDLDMKFADVESMDYVLAELNNKFGK